MASQRHLLLACAILVGLAGLAASARLDQAQLQPISNVLDNSGSPAELAASQSLLLTYYFDASKPQIKLGSSSRPERTSITVTLPGAASVSKFMPVVSPRPSGMTHEVANTWQALKNLAAMFKRVGALNAQAAAGPAAPRLFPRAALAVSSASDNAPGKLDVNTIMAHGPHSAWTETTPGSVLLLPHGQSTAAVADVMGAAYEATTDTITLNLDIVHEPHTISEFEPHGKQTVQVDQAHYHFATAPGVNVDAQGLIKSLESSGFALEGLHMFLKGVPTNPSCYYADVTADPTEARVGDTVVVNATIYQLPSCQASKGATPDPHASQVSEVPFIMAVLGPGTFGITPGRGGSANNSINATQLPAAWRDKLKEQFAARLKNDLGVMDTSNEIAVLVTGVDGTASIPVNVAGEGPIYVAVGGYPDGPPTQLDFTVINRQPPQSCFTAEVVADPTDKVNPGTSEAGTSVDVTVTLAIADRDDCAGTTTDGGVKVYLSVLGPATATAPPQRSSRVPGSAALPPHMRGLVGAPAFVELLTNETGVATQAFDVGSAPGPITFLVAGYTDGVATQQDFDVVQVRSCYYGIPTIVQSAESDSRGIISVQVFTLCDNVPLQGVTLELALLGNGELVPLEPDSRKPTPSQSQRRQSQFTLAVPLTTDSSGVAQAVYETSGDGTPVQVVVTGFSDGVPQLVDYATIDNGFQPPSCYSASITATPTQAAPGNSVQVDITLSDYNCGVKAAGNGTAPALRDGASAKKDVSGVQFRVGIIGPATFTGIVAQPSRAPLPSPTGRYRNRKAGALEAAGAPLELMTNLTGQVSFTAGVTGDGPITFVITDYGDGVITRVDYAPVNYQCDAPPNPGGVDAPISKLQLLLSKARHHVHEPVTVTALAWDDNNSPVVGANITFSASGDCNPILSKTVATTDGFGRASVTVMAHEPGVVTVVAAGVNAEGVAVVSAPAQIVFHSHYGGEYRHEDGHDQYPYGGPEHELRYGRPDEYERYSDNNEYYDDQRDARRRF